MFRYQSNKKAFVIAVSVILLCAICLTGATLALFTSGGKDGTIGIITTTGVVKVDLVDAADEETSLVGQVLQILTSSDNKHQVPLCTGHSLLRGVCAGNGLRGRVAVGAWLNEPCTWVSTPRSLEQTQGASCESLGG